MTVALRDQLGGPDVEGWHRYLDDGPGWQVESAGQVLNWSPVGPPLTEGTRTRWSVAHSSGLQAAILLERDAAFGTAILRVTLQNTADQPSIPISALKPVRLGLPTLSPEDAWVRSVGGGLTTAFYPPWPTVKMQWSSGKEAVSAFGSNRALTAARRIATSLSCN